MRSIANPQRGCGTLKAGGTYLGGSFGAGGRLEPWTWTLGYQIERMLNLSISAPPRAMKLFNLPYTLGTGRLVEDPEAMPSMGEMPGDIQERIKKLPKVALLDHVGSAYYTPWQFAQEVRNHGPSRRVPPDIAAQVAPFLPIPIVFTHSAMPMLAGIEDIYPVLKWSAGRSFLLDPNREVQPTYFDPAWGLTVRTDKATGQRYDPYDGHAHWTVAALRELHGCTAGTKIKSGQIPDDVWGALSFSEAIFGISWITRATYVVRGDESDEQLEEYRNRGIEPVIPDDIGE